MLNLTGKVAVITGASSGIGRETARVFSRQGAKVVLVARREAALQALSEELKGNGGNVLIVPGDVTVPGFADEVCEKAVAAFGAVDILVNNAGMGDNNMATVRTDDELWNKVTALDETAVFYFCRAALRVMTKQNSGSIINISSIGGVYSIAGAAYSAAKAAIIGLTKNIAIQYVGTGIRCNAVCPGPTMTDMMTGGEGENDMQMVEKVVKHVDMGAGYSQPEDMANIILFFAADESRGINGQILVADKGSCI